MQTLPSFWKVAKGYMEGKYQKVSAPSSCMRYEADSSVLLQKNVTASNTTRRSPTQCRVMTQDIVTLYVSLLSSFFSLSSSTALPQMSVDDPNATPPLPPFVPASSNATANCHWLLKTLNELSECVFELNGLELAGEASQSLRELVSSMRWRIEEAICSSWVRGEVERANLECSVLTWRTSFAQMLKSSSSSRHGSLILTMSRSRPICAVSLRSSAFVPSLLIAWPAAARSEPLRSSELL